MTARDLAAAPSTSLAPTSTGGHDSSRSTSPSPSSFGSDVAAPSLSAPQRALLADALDRPSAPIERERRRSPPSAGTSPPTARLLQRSSSGRGPIAETATTPATPHVDLSKPPPAALPPERVTGPLPPRRRASSDARHRANALMPAEPSSVLDLFAGRGLTRKRTMSISSLAGLDITARHSSPATEGEADDGAATTTTTTTRSRRPSIDSSSIIRRGSYVNADLEDATRRRSIDIPFPILSAPSPAQWWQSLFGTASSEGETKRQLDDEDVAKGDELPWERVKAHYRAPKAPMILCHGLFGFDTLGPQNMPALQIAYWRGVKNALEAIGAEVLITSVPTSASIEERARALVAAIEPVMRGREVNLIGHSMGGLDSRFLVSQLKPTTFTVKSVTTIATPHRGSPFADYMLDEVVGRQNLDKLLNLVNSVGIPGGGKAFDQLTTIKMARFNVDTPDDPNVRYFSYTASFRPGWFDVFRTPWRIIHDVDGANDGLVSVASQRWGVVQGNLEDVNHLDIVGWQAPYIFTPPRFRPASFFCTIAEMLAENDL